MYPCMISVLFRTLLAKLQTLHVLNTNNIVQAVQNFFEEYISQSR